jgi:hypothetical protein
MGGPRTGDPTRARSYLYESAQTHQNRPANASPLVRVPGLIRPWVGQTLTLQASLDAVNQALPSPTPEDSYRCGAGERASRLAAEKNSPPCASFRTLGFGQTRPAEDNRASSDSR